MFVKILTISNQIFMKKHQSLVALALLVSFAVFGQQNNSLLSTPGELIEINDTPEPPQDDIKDFSEYSIGVMWMPIPLFIKELQFEGATNFSNDENIFNMGWGLALNADFLGSGFGPGMFGYVSIIGGDNARAYDYFGALKYDFPLGDKLTTNFEISPTVGIGGIEIQNKDSEEYYGSSLYFSGGARLTWRVSNLIFIGGDVLLSPVIFSPEKLWGVEDDNNVDSLKIKYKSPVTVNFSVRFNLL